MITLTLWKHMLMNSVNLLRNNVLYLCELDSITGDGDHGVTIARICDCIEKRINQVRENDSIKNINGDLGISLMNINGGSAGPLFGTIFEGMSESIDELDELDLIALKKMFEGAKNSFKLISKADIGDKTLVDALYPAVDIISASNGNMKDIFKGAYEAASNGAEKTKDYIAKFGRAKNIADRSLGFKDPGAVSISLLFKGLYEALLK